MKEKVLFSDLKTLYICPSENWGTLERKALSDCLIQRDFGGNPHLFCLKDSKLDKEAIKWDIQTINYTGKKVNRVLDFRYLIDLYKLFKSYSFDVVHCYNLHFLWEVCFLLKTKQSIPLLFTFNDYLDKPQNTYLQNWLFKRVDQLLVFSHTLKDTAQETLPVSNRRIKISGNGVEVVKKSEDKVERVKNLNCMVTSPADLEQVKTLIFAMKSLIPSFEDRDIKLNLNVYSMTHIEKFPEYEKTIALGHDNHIADNIHFHKIASDTDVFKNADVFIGTAFNEPFNDYEMTAMISKIPVLLPRTASRQYILNHYQWTGESYYYADSREAKSKLLKILLNDQVYLNELESQHQAFLDNHGIDAYVSRLIGFYEKNYSKRVKLGKLISKNN